LLYGKLIAVVRVLKPVACVVGVLLSKAADEIRITTEFSNPSE
jgi:hypothetical protein